MISFTVITDTPGRLRDFLIARGVIEEVTDSEGTHLRGVRPGMEWVRVPNPIRIDETDSPVTEPDVDDRNVYLVKFAHESLSEEAAIDFDSPAGSASPVDSEEVDTAGDVWDWSKFARWVKNNSTIANAPAGWTINGEPAGSARKINGQNVWIVHDRPERFGVWQ
jgi:hypothetical protein